MRLPDLMKLSTRMFKARTSRTLLTILGMSVGIGAILFLVSLGYGLQKTLLERITTSESLLTLDITEAKSGVVELNNEEVEKIKILEGVSEVSPAFQVSSQGQMGELKADLIAIGIHPSFFRLGGFHVSEGKGINDEEKNGVVINSSVAQLFGKSVDEMIGQEINMTFFLLQSNNEDRTLQNNYEGISSEEKYKVVGFIEGDENIIYLNSATTEKLGISKFSQLKVKCVSNDAMNGVRDRILEQGLLVSSLSDTVDQANQIFGIIQIVLISFGIIALIVSAIGMFNTMTIALLERTGEIGIMKSIGASRSSISIMFIAESTIMGILGGIGGVVVGILGGKIFNTIINLVASRFGGQPVNLFYSPMWFIVVIVVFAGFVGLFTGIVPARRASKIDPLDALRYK